MLVLVGASACDGSHPTAPSCPPVCGQTPDPTPTPTPTPPPVPPPPQLQVTKFMAFGDSLTEGEVQTNSVLLSYEPEHSYPTYLLAKLQARYTAQQFTMANEGLGGSSAAGDNDNGRFRHALDTDQPEVVLLLHGIADLYFNPDQDGIENLAHGLRDDVRAARAKNASVFVSTLLAQKDALPGYPNRHWHSDELLAQANAAIRGMAADEGATVVDGYAAVDADRARYIGGDGLHLTVEGYQALADAFLAAIKAKYEVASSSAPAFRRGLPSRTNVEIRSKRAR